MGKATDSDYLKYKGMYPTYSRIFTAMFIDLVAVNLIAFAVIKLYALAAGNFLDRYTLSYIGFGLYLVCLLYVPFLSAKGQTLGQKLAGIKIRRVDGGHMSLGQATLRWLLSIFSFSGYGKRKVPPFDRRCDTVTLDAKAA